MAYSLLRYAAALAGTLTLAHALGSAALAHCDTMDGPVVTAGREALETGDPDPALVWVREQDEPLIRRTLQEATAVRGLGPLPRKVADTHFLETLVRVHRAGEGAPYTGLKPAGGDLGPAISAADQALKTGDPDSLYKLVGDAVEKGLRERYQRVRALKDYDPDDVEAGRRYVAAYVEYVHYVEGLYNAAASPVGEHHAASEDADPGAAHRAEQH